MRHAWIFAVPVALLALGCSSSSSDDALPDVQSSDVESVDSLSDLDIGADELVGDDADSSELESDTNEMSDEAIASLPESVTATDDDLSDMTFTGQSPEELAEPTDDPAVEEADLSPGAVGNLAPMAKTTNPTWWNKTYSCERRPIGGDCVCRGSAYNCQFPNAQPGRNRYLPPAAIRLLNQTTGKETRLKIIDALGRWDVEQGTNLYDGVGAPRGALSGGCYGDDLKYLDKGHPCVKVNFGQVKMIRGVKYVYAFATSRGSGWIPRSKIMNASFHAYNTPPRKATQFAATDYVLKSAEDYHCDPATYDSTKCLPPWAQKKIKPMSSPLTSEKARDYLLRDGNFINLCYQTPLLGGAADDTFLVAKEQLRFKRAKSIDADHRTILRISLYNAASKHRVGTMHFLYGEIAGRMGWVAAAAVKRGTVKANAASAGDDQSTICKDKADGTYCNPNNEQLAYACKGGSVYPTPSCPAGQKCVGPNGPGALICQ